MSHPPTEQELLHWRSHYNKYAVARMLEEIRRLRNQVRHMEAVRQKNLELKRAYRRLAKMKTS